MKRLLKKILTKGFRNALKNAAREGEICVRHWRGVAKARRKYRGVFGLKLNVGCGPNLKKGWVNIDFRPDSDLGIDLRENLPFDTDSCDMIYSEHFMAHIDFPDEVNRFVSESFRILRPGGTFSAGVLDSQWPIQAYNEGPDADFFKHARERWNPAECVTRMQHINYHFRQKGEHRFCYDFETMVHVLEKAGFVNVRMRDFDPELDSEKRRLGTLYVDATKPPCVRRNKI